MACHSGVRTLRCLGALHPTPSAAALFPPRAAQTRRDVHPLQLHAGFRGHQLLQPRAPESNTQEGCEDASLRGGGASSTCTCSTCSSLTPSVRTHSRRLAQRSSTWDASILIKGRIIILFSTTLCNLPRQFCTVNMVVNISFLPEEARPADQKVHRIDLLK